MFCYTFQRSAFRHKQPLCLLSCDLVKYGQISLSRLIQYTCLLISFFLSFFLYFKSCCWNQCWMGIRFVTKYPLGVKVGIWICNRWADFFSNTRARLITSNFQKSAICPYPCPCIWQFKMSDVHTQTYTRAKKCQVYQPKTLKNTLSNTQWFSRGVQPLGQRFQDSALPLRVFNRVQGLSFSRSHTMF